MPQGAPEASGRQSEETAMRAEIGLHHPPAWLLAVAMTVAMAAAACTSSVLRSSSYGPVVTLRIGVYGASDTSSPGSTASTRKSIRTSGSCRLPLGSQASYWSALRAHLASGTGLDDIQAVALDEISTITASTAGDFVSLNTLGASEHFRAAACRGPGQRRPRPAARRPGWEWMSARWRSATSQPAARGRAAREPDGARPAVVNPARLHPGGRAASPRMPRPQRPSWTRRRTSAMPWSASHVSSSRTPRGSLP